MTDLKAAGVAPLYSLATEYLRILDLLEDPDADAQELEQQLDAIAGAITDKANAIGSLIQTYKGLAEQRDAEIKRMKELVTADEKRATRLRDYLLRNMVALGTEKIDTARFSIRLRRNPPAVEILEQLLVPEQFVRVVTSTSVDKRAVLDNFKTTGEIPPGVEITRSIRLEIR